MNEDQLNAEFGQRLKALFGDDYRSTDGYRAVVAECVTGTRVARNVVSDLEAVRHATERKTTLRGPSYPGAAGWYSRFG